MPIPERATGETVLLLLKVNDPVRLLVAVGVKVTVTVQLLPASSPLPQLLVSLKSPLTLMLLIVSVAVPVLLKVTLCEELELFTS